MPDRIHLFGLLLFLTGWLLTGCSGNDGCTCPSTARTVVVDPEGTGDYPTIQGAIDAADSLDTIELTDGLFTGSGNRDLDFLGKAITLRSESGNPAACIIDCEGVGTEQHWGVRFSSGEGPQSLLQGITIRGGSVGIWPGPVIGATVCCENESAPTIRDCVFYGNHARKGGAVSCSWKSSPHRHLIQINNN